MAQTYSVRADLSANASKFTSAFQQATSATETFGQKLKSGMKLGGAMAIGEKIVSRSLSAISGNIDSAISRFDTLNNYPKVMKTLGFSMEEAAKSSKKMDAGIEGLPTSMDEITSNVQILAATMGDLDKATEVGVAMNHMLLASGKGAEGAGRAFTQFSQMLATGKVDMQSWRSMVEVASPQLNQLAESLLGAGKGQTDLYNAMKDGEVTFDDFNKALVKLDKNGGKNFASFSDQAIAGTQGIATSMKNVKTAVVKNLANLIKDADPLIAQFIASIDKGFGKKYNADKSISGIAEMFNKVKSSINSAFGNFRYYIDPKSGEETIGKYGKSVKAFVEGIAHTVNTLKPAGEAIGHVIGKIVNAFLQLSASALNSKAVETLSDVFVRLAHIVGNNVAPVTKAMSKIGGAFANIITSERVGKVMNMVSEFVHGIATGIADRADRIGQVLEKVGGKIAERLGMSFGGIDTGNLADMVLAGIDKIVDFADKHADEIAALVDALIKFKLVKKAPGMGMIASGLKKIAAVGLTNLGTKLVETATGMVDVGNASKTSSKQILAGGAAWMMIATSVAIVAGAFALITKSAIELANAGPGAVAVFIGMGTAIAGMLIGLTTFTKTFSVAPQQAAGMLILGAAIAVVAAGFYVLASAAVMLAESGGAAMAVFFGMVTAIGGLIAIVSIFSSGLLVGAVAIGIIAGALFLLSTRSEEVSAVLQAFGQLATTIFMGLISVISTAGQVITQILMGVSVVFATVFNGIALVVTSVGNAIAAVLTGIATVISTVFQGMADVITSIGESINTALQGLGDAFTSFGNAVDTILNGVSGVVDSVGSAISGVLDSVAGIFESMGNAALKAGTGVSRMAGGIAKLVRLPLADTAATLGTVASGLRKIGSSAKGVGSIGTAFRQIGSGVAVIVKTASTAASAMSKLVSALRSAGPSAQSAGRSVGTGFGNGVKTGMKTATTSTTAGIKQITNAMKKGVSGAKSAAHAMVSAMNSQLRNGYARAYATGAYISQGMANGLTSALGRIESAAARIVAAAEKAANAKAKVGSPSRVFMKIGGFIGEGLAIGIKKEGKNVYKASYKMGGKAESGINKSLGISSPSKKTAKSGRWTAKGFIKGLKTGSTKLPAQIKKSLISAFGTVKLSSIPKTLKKSIQKILGGGKGKKITGKTLKKLKEAIGREFSAKNVGKNMVNNLKGSLTLASSYAKDAFAQMSKEVSKWTYMDLGTDNVDFRAVGERASETFAKGYERKASRKLDAGTDYITKQTNKQVRKATDLQKKYEQKSKKFNAKANKAKGKSKKKYQKLANKYDKKAQKMGANADSYRSAADTLKSEFESAYNDMVSQAKESAQAQINAISEKYDKLYNDLKQKRDNFFGKLSDFGSLFDTSGSGSDSYGFGGGAGGGAFKDFKKATSTLKEYEANLYKLRDAWGVNKEMLEEVTQGMSVEDALTYTNALIAQGQEFAKTMGNDYAEYMSTANQIASTWYKGDFASLQAGYQAELAQVQSDLNSELARIGTECMDQFIYSVNRKIKELSGVGKKMAQGLANGISGKKSTKKVTKASKKTAKKATKATKKKLKVKSPSRVFMGIGENVSLGLAKGIEHAQRSVSNAMNRLAEIPTVASPEFAGAFGGELSSDYTYGMHLDGTIEVPVEIDGKQVAKATAQYTEEELNKIQTRNERKNGRI